MANPTKLSYLLSLTSDTHWQKGDLTGMMIKESMKVVREKRLWKITPTVYYCTSTKLGEITGVRLKRNSGENGSSRGRDIMTSIVSRMGQVTNPLHTASPQIQLNNVFHSIHPASFFL